MWHQQEDGLTHGMISLIFVLGLGLGLPLPQSLSSTPPPNANDMKLALMQQGCSSEMAESLLISNNFNYEQAVTLFRQALNR